MNTIAIIGGGASGLAAALAARESLDNRVVLLERQNRVGRKLLATGNGRCNLTNTNASPEHYHGQSICFLRPSMSRFDTDETLTWFSSLGLITRTEPSGRVYPLSDAASSVVDVLRLAAEARGAQLRCGVTIAAAKKTKSGFLLSTTEGDELPCNKLIIACGGMAGAKLGGVRFGYDLLRSFGHGCTPLSPSLVQLKTDDTYTRSMKGVRTQADLTLERQGTVLARARGEVQFTDYGITGPGVFDLSRAAACCGDGCMICLRLLPELEEVDIISYMKEKIATFPNYKTENLLSGTLHNSICRTLLRRAEISQDAHLWSLNDHDIARIAGLIARFELALMRPLGFEEAQVTAGGVLTDDFDPATMESRLVPGLYACGEVLDIDGDCGGYNLQWAWSSGRLAGLSAAALI